jgi:carboxymethylenebutenolidase
MRIEPETARSKAMGQWLQLNAHDGFRLSAYRAEPEHGARRRGGLVVVQEIFGVNSHIRSVCDGFAADGYVAVAPALFDRYRRNFETGYTPEDIAVGRELKAKAAPDAALADVAAARDAAADAGKVGIVGYCWGGFIAWMSGARVSGLACAVPYYGGGIVEAANEQPECPVMGHFGERDAAIPVAGVRQLAQAHPEAQIFFYDAEHGFNCDQRKSYDAASAKLARERTLAFLRQHIG